MVLVSTTLQGSVVESGAELGGFDLLAVQKLVSRGDDLGEVRELVEVCVAIREHLSAIQWSNRGSADKVGVGILGLLAKGEGVDDMVEVQAAVLLVQGDVVVVATFVMHSFTRCKVNVTLDSVQLRAALNAAALVQSVVDHINIALAFTLLYVLAVEEGPALFTVGLAHVITCLAADTFAFCDLVVFRLVARAVAWPTVPLDLGVLVVYVLANLKLLLCDLFALGVDSCLGEPGIQQVDLVLARIIENVQVYYFAGH